MVEERRNGITMGLEEKLANVPPRSIVVLEVSAEENQMKLVAEFLKSKEKTGSYGVYVSSNRPTTNLVEKVTDYGYDLKKALDEGRVCVVDLVSKSLGETEMNGVICVSSASELSATQLAIEKAVKRIESKDGSGWFLLDSIATLLVFNSPDSLLGFLHFLLGRLRVLKLSGIIFATHEGIETKVVTTIKQLCDATLKL